MKGRLRTAIVEVGFIIFLFYSNLLMGQYERSGGASERGLGWAVMEILTLRNFAIAIVAATVGYLVVEHLRKRAASR